MSDNISIRLTVFQEKHCGVYPWFAGNLRINDKRIARYSRSSLDSIYTNVTDVLRIYNGK